MDTDIALLVIFLYLVYQCLYLYLCLRLCVRACTRVQLATRKRLSARGLLCVFNVPVRVANIFCYSSSI